jgi:hypothetical protein
MRSLEEMVSEYKGCGFLVTEEERDFYASAPIMEDAIARAMVRGPDGKMHSHQRRIGRERLDVAADRLLGAVNVLNNAESFEQLHQGVVNRTEALRGVGELTQYDVAQRIGAYLGLRPGVVYLHAGTRRGARHLGLEYRRSVLQVSELRDELRTLPPDHVENFLCIYEREFAGDHPGAPGACRRCLRPLHAGCR